MMVLTTPRADRQAHRATTSARRRGRTENYVAAGAMVAPALILFTLFIVLPMLAVIALSFFEWRYLDVPRFVGFDNYAKMLSDADAGKALLVTFQFLLLGVLPTIALGFLVAVLVNAPLRGISVLRVLYFVPVVLSVAVSAVVWGFMLDPRYGPIGSMFRAVGIEIPDVLETTTWVVPTLTVIMVWGALPIVILLYLAALQRISPDVYQAAQLDGAGPWRVTWSVTWPAVMPTTIVIAVLQVIGFSAGALDLALILTRGGPLGSSRALGLYIYEEAFVRQDPGYAATLSILQILVIASLAVIGRRLAVGRRS